MSSEMLIGEIIVLLALAVALIYFGLKLRMPAIVGFLATGIMVGPAGLGLIKDAHQVDALAELGVVLLLFTIGLELSVTSLMRIKRIVLLGGSLQVTFCVAVTWVVAMLTGYHWNTAILFGFLFSLSSTAIVLKLFQERGEMDSLHGRSALGVLIFQDLAVVPMVLVLPALAGESNSDPIYIVLGKALLLLAVVLFLAHKVVPWLLRKVAATKSRELFLFTVALICLGTAYLTAEAGLSLALGAFVAGLIISGSPYAYQAISSVMPMRDIFTSLFFISIGMLMDMQNLIHHPVSTIGVAAGIMIMNIIATTLAMRVTGLNWRVSVMIGFSLCQIGEFSFVLAKNGESLGLLGQSDMTVFLNAAVLTMAMTPLALALGGKIAPRLRGSDPRDTSHDNEGPQPPQAVVVGFGVAGQGMVRACKVAGVPYAIVEMNPQSIQAYRREGEPIIYGDAVNETVLEHVNIENARLLVTSIPDRGSVRRIVAEARSLNPKLHIIARTRFLMEKEVLLKLGADEVVAEEFEAAISVFAKTMHFFGVSDEEGKKRLDAARAAGPANFHLGVEAAAESEKSK
ncbi:hypothetical protein C4J81_10470 [Deltaproteobacteria bacterium Smac51]|nr:hypothetical protein C4J81_10470 [Deltaproteobacteria bacterium Smac51]